MQFRPIISAMRRNKVGAVLIAVQMAITLAILCNALFLIEQRVAWSQRPTGTDEANVVVIQNQWVGSPPDLAARLQGDLAALRSLPGVQDATSSNTYPLSGGGSTTGLSLKPDQKNATALASIYFGDEHAIAAFGLKLIAGRNFNSDEVVNKMGYTDLNPPAGIIVTRTLAEKLFPNGSAVGQSVYEESIKGQIPIVGVVDRMQVPWVGAGGWGSKFSESSLFMPFHFLSSYPTYYLVRSQPGQAAAVMQAAQKKLFDISRARVIGKALTLAAARTEAYKDDKGLVVILAVVCASLLAVTSFGIVGLTSYWVAQRRRQIGIRRALGATRNAIIQYFQTENLLIAGAGAVLGIAMAVSLNLWMVNIFAMQRLNTGYALIGAIVVLVLGQIAVLWPALRAASVPPALATRAA
ncbi:MAG TPA: FtsX-like permease family protein [Steroidobacteraceae bacterium]|jgi:putative ABC transport system permease protein|nr:FtsX-like permease family protein [Steroidobacteraceae bacterium]